MRYFIQIIFVGLLVGCKTSDNHYAIIATGTVIGIELSESLTTQMPQAKLGYHRSEVAIVPTNRPIGDNKFYGGGASDTPEVIIELNFKGMFKRDGGIYQRVAIGRIAVAGPGAAYMFGKNGAGELSPMTARAISQSLGTIPETSDTTERLLEPLASAYAASGRQTDFDAVAEETGYEDFADFILNGNLNIDDIALIRSRLNSEGLLR